MKEVKMRIWDPIAERMLEWKEIKDIRMIESDTYDKLLYTGLKDRNGKEIYEGDIVTRHEGGIHFYEEPLAIHQVTFGEVGWAPFECIEGHGRGARDFYKNIYDFIVIGNIYENPELVRR